MVLFFCALPDALNNYLLSLFPMPTLECRRFLCHFLSSSCAGFPHLRGNIFSYNVVIGAFKKRRKEF